MNIEQARFNMIEQQIRPWNVLDTEVLALLAVAKREEFVPAAYRAMAFVDTRLPLPQGQCMLEPKLEARMLQEIGVQRHHRVLEVGAGSGYMAALLAHRAQEVVTMEIVPELARLAADNLRRASVVNARVVEGDGAKGLPGEAPFDAIVLSGSVASLPQALMDQLKVGGRLIGIVGNEPVMRATLVTRTREREWTSHEVFDTMAPRLVGFDEPSRFSF